MAGLFRFFRKILELKFLGHQKYLRANLYHLLILQLVCDSLVAFFDSWLHYLPLTGIFKDVRAERNLHLARSPSIKSMKVTKYFWLPISQKVTVRIPCLRSQI